MSDPRIPELAERLRKLHNSIRPQLAKAQQDELLELAIGLGLVALDQKRIEEARCESSSQATEVS